ncbi:hypothetical protein [Sphingobium sp. C100]|uniref:hypothetical protein n=1 Tax=Sphingobium sp. C100 TaxID=1207055 RepID=UPI0012688F27|nr:hypothetical protein [Sphingobium sp. C100]
MERLCSLILPLLLAGCSLSVDEHQDGMNRVENAIVMPAGARPWQEYARYYSVEPDGKIIGIFIIPDNRDRQNKFYNLSAGNRRWVGDYRNLPSIVDGGCGVLTVTLDPKSRKREGPFCNGEA